MGKYSQYRKVRPGKRLKKILLSDLKKMDSGRLGLSQQEKEQAAMAAKTSAAQQGAALQRNVQRQAMAQGASSPFTGQAAKLQRDIAEGAGRSAAGAYAAVDEASARLAESRRQEIMARLDKQRDVTRQNTKQIADAVGKGFELGGNLLSGIIPGGG